MRNTHSQALSDRVIGWQRVHGRHDLPWQGTGDPYRVWLSEIMLQQTQVATVRAYYPRFLSRFPDVQALSAAGQDDVLSLWSGLGYYSRARNLHRCAQEVVTRFGGVFPGNAAELATLPGIGRSTAAAIAAFCFGERVAILDGNVKRVLSRVLGIADDLSEARHERALWSRAQDLLPDAEPMTAMPSYTQGLMDLGATVCIRRAPACAPCPLSDMCVARREGEPERYPVKTRRIRRMAQQLWLLHALDGQGRVYLSQRPETGIWARLYCLPAFEARHDLMIALPEAVRDTVTEHTAFTHALTHRELHIHVVTVRQPGALAGPDGAWHGPDQWPLLGLPAPVRRFLTAFEPASPALPGP